MSFDKHAAQRTRQAEAGGESPVPLTPAARACGASKILPRGAGWSAPRIEWRRVGEPQPHDSGFGGDARGAEPASADLEQRAAPLIEAAREQGRAEGEAAGERRAQQRLDPVIAQLQGLIAELAAQRSRLRAEAEEDTVRLALAVARRVLYRELAIDGEAMLGLVKAASARLNARETHRLRLSPGDAALLQQYRGRLNLPPAVEIVADPALPAGSAVFETARGEVDASVETQLKEIERGLVDMVHRRRG
jgi:flagellar assembly protein FliH